MEPQCSCSACSSFACLGKQHPLSIYGYRKADRTYLFYNNIDKNVSTFSLDDFKLEQKVSKEYKDEIDASVNFDSENFTETFSDDKWKDRHDKGYFISSLRPSAAKLSAQVMNVPFKDFESSLRRIDPAPETNVSKLTSFDIFEKIKQVYQACSCKVCECIVGKAQKNEVCKCKPCDCDDCKHLQGKKKVTISNNFITRAESDCIRLKRSLLKQFSMEELKQECNCKPCECADCAINETRPCSCEQSHCIECKARYTHNKYQKLVVASLESENQSHQDCMCSPCNCAECSHRNYGLTPNLRHEMSTEINRPEGCHCEACLNEACLSDGANTCSCERRHRVMRKPVQRDTDYDIHRTIIKQQNPCKQDLIAMFAAISKIHPDSHVKKCKCGRCECLYCNNYKEDSANALKTSNVNISDDNRNMYDTVPYKSPQLDRGLVPRKSSLKTTRVTPNFKNLQRPSEIKAISKFSSNKTCSPCDCINFDNMRATCTGDVCDCTHSKCERCIFNDVIYPVKKGEKLTPAIFENKMNRSFITLCDEKNQNDDIYEAPQKARLSSVGGHYKMNVPTNDLVVLCDEHSPENYPSIEQQFYQKDSPKFKKKHRVYPFSDSSSTAQAFNRNVAVRLQASNSKMVANYPISNYENSVSNPQPDNKYHTKKCVTADQSDSNFYIQFPTKRTAYRSDINCLDKFTNNKHEKINILSKCNTDNLNVSRNFHSRYAKGLFGMNALTSRSIKDSERNPRKFKYNECFIENDNLRSVNKSSHNIIIGKNNSSNKVSVTQTVNQNKMFFSQMKETAAEDCKRSVHYSENFENAHNYTNDTDSEESKNVVDTTANNFDLDEDYIRVQKTVKDARAFSLHLMKLLEKYEKANREFESVFHKLTQSETKKYMIQDIISISQNVSHEVNAIKPISEDYSVNDTTNVSFDNVPAIETHSNALFFDCRQKINDEDRLNLHLRAIKSSDFLTEYMDMNLNNGSITKNTQDSSKHITTKDSGKVDNKIAYIELKQKKLSSESICNSSRNDDAIIEFEHNSSNTLSLNNSDIVHDSISCEKNLYPIIEANTPISIPENFSVKRRITKKVSKRYTNMYKRAVIVTKRRKIFAPTFAKCSITTETNDLFSKANESCQEFNILLKDKESKLSMVVTESVVDETAYVATNDSATTTDTTGNIYYFKPRSRIQHQEIAEHRDFMIKSPLETEHSNTKEAVAVSMSTKGEDMVGIFRKQSLDKGIKEAVNAIKQASITWEANYAKAHQDPEDRHENVTLMKLHSEVKKLLEMPLLQKSKIQNHSQCDESREPKHVDKCESLKVSFLTVQKLSDSTVVVKWQVPTVLENVQGYEVLVNGRAVQKIHDNMCYESALSGLPRSNKILVTVRTVTKRSCPSGHCPTATVVYRPGHNAELQGCNRMFYSLTQC